MLVSLVPACKSGTAWSGSVKVGLVVPFYGYDSGSANAAYFATKLAIKERNEGGGVGGRWVELVALDDENSYEVAAYQAREIALDPDVLGVIGHLNSDTALGAAPGYREAGLVAITLGGSAADLASSYPEVLRMAPDDSAVAAFALQAVARRMPLKRIAVLHDASPGHSSAANAFVAEASQQKLDIATVSEIDKGQLESVPVLEALAAKPPELLVFVGDQFQAASLASQARQILKDTRILIAGCANTPDFVRIAGESAIGVLHVEGAAQDSTAANRFAAGYQSAFGLPPGAFAFAAYDATRLLLSAMDSAAGGNGKPDRASVSKNMRTGASAQSASWPGLDGGRRGFNLGLYETDESGYQGRLWQ